MGKIRIALIHDFLTDYGGAERVLSVLHGMYPEAPIYTLLADQAVVAKHFPKATVITSYLQNSLFKNRRSWLLSKYPAAIESFNLTEFDVVLSSSGAFSHGVITSPDTTHICYCHSPMRYAWDWHAEYLEEKGITSPLGTYLANRVMNKIRLWDAISAKRVDTWVANSSVVAGRIQHYYRSDSVVIHPPVDTDFFNPEALDKPVEKKGYAFTAGRLVPYKRVHQMIAACAKAGIPLKIAGTGSAEAGLRQVAAALEADVEFLGFISEEDKRQRLAEAVCFLFAAEDDFGIAPVEALSVGTPVIALGKGGIVDSIEDGKNGILYPEATPESLEEALEKFQKQGVGFSKEQLRTSALAFSTQTFTDKIHKLVEHAGTR